MPYTTFRQEFKSLEQLSRLTKIMALSHSKLVFIKEWFLIFYTYLNENNDVKGEKPLELNRVPLRTMKVLQRL